MLPWSLLKPLPRCPPTLCCLPPPSLAVAPTLSIWRLTPQQYYAKRLAHDMLDAGDDDDDDKHNRMVTRAV